ncbi:hypothetical protein LCGC14_2484490 [marine sediment metagenome]|uniref:Uncharacterized protein n=1 Tax=marine sediment metagenome TaxID=412755 RepID=A0A0F9B7B9_9ZZZZ
MSGERTLTPQWRRALYDLLKTARAEMANQHRQQSCRRCYKKRAVTAWRTTREKHPISSLVFSLEPMDACVEIEYEECPVCRDCFEILRHGLAKME